jgi:HTH-type transcriptional regulator/antitoxin HigA
MGQRLESMQIRQIRNERDYHRALKQIERLMNAKRNTPEGRRLDSLVTLVQEWERKVSDSAEPWA